MSTGALAALFFAGQVHRQARRDALGQILVDVAQIAEHPQSHRLQRHLRQFEGEGRRDMRLLDVGLRAEEQARLAVMVGERIRTDAELFAGVVALVVDRDRRKPCSLSRGPPSSPASPSELGS